MIDVCFNRPAIPSSSSFHHKTSQLSPRMKVSTSSNFQDPLLRLPKEIFLHSLTSPAEIARSVAINHKRRDNIQSDSTLLSTAVMKNHAIFEPEGKYSDGSNYVEMQEAMNQAVAQLSSFSNLSNNELIEASMNLWAFVDNMSVCLTGLEQRFRCQLFVSSLATSFCFRLRLSIDQWFDTDSLCL